MANRRENTMRPDSETAAFVVKELEGVASVCQRAAAQNPSMQAIADAVVTAAQEAKKVQLSAHASLDAGAPSLGLGASSQAQSAPDESEDESK